MAFIKILANINYYYFFTQTVTHICKTNCIGITSEIYQLCMVTWTIVIDQEMPRFVFHIAFLGHANNEKPIQVVRDPLTSYMRV